jgi:disulfide bond formation protein DsbB
MKILLGGIVALVIGVIGLIVWFFDFLLILKGVVPIALILGGALAIYLGIEDIKTSASSEEEPPTSGAAPKESKE